MKDHATTDSILVVENIRSTFNVGGLFRLADAVGIAKIILVGYTPQPTDRFGRNNEKLAKTALGAEQTIPCEHSDDVVATLSALKKTHTIIAIEQGSSALCYTKHHYHKSAPNVFIVGNEVDGVSNQAQALADVQVYIPMYGEKESLNLTTAAAIVLYHARMAEPPVGFEPTTYPLQRDCSTN